MHVDSHLVSQKVARFLELAYPQDDGWTERLATVELELARTGRYWHTPSELELGAKIAWRQNARCIGRLVWHQLVVRDLRSLGSQEEIFSACLDHLRLSTNGGRIVPMISVFRPDGPRILNSQLIRYADDPAQADFVVYLRTLGWTPSANPFEVLPLAIAWPGRPTLVRALPDEVVLEVAIQSSQHSAINDLKMRWHALPAMSDRVLEIGGVLYQCAPFSGWYMGTEIGARDLGDPDRYDKLTLVAEALGLDTTSERTLWKDRALVELNVAVLESFERAGVTIVDHHTASRQFLKFLANERAAEREVNAEWSWIVPPMSGSLTRVFHTPMSEFACSPNFLTRAQAGLERPLAR